MGPERQGSNFLRGSKNEDYQATVKAVGSTAAALGGLFRVAGFEDAAKKLRGRPRRLANGAGEEEMAGGSPAAATPAPAAQAPAAPGPAAAAG